LFRTQSPNDIRWLASGPRLGLGKSHYGDAARLIHHAGKVNPVMCEMLIQVGAQVIGNDAAITFGGAYGNFELNVMMPVIAYNLMQSISLLTNGTRVFARRCVVGLEADVENANRTSNEVWQCALLSRQ